MIQQYIGTEQFIFGERTRLNADASAAAASIDVRNTSNYAANDYILVGYYGAAQAELRKINAITDSDTISLTGSVLVFAHDRFEHVTKVLYNQRKLYSCATEDGTYTLVATFGLGVNDPSGTYVTDTGTNTFYKVTYYNQTTTKETSLADAPVIKAETTEVKVVDTDLRYCTHEEIRDISGFRDTGAVSSDKVERVRYQAENMVDGKISTRYTLPLTFIPYLIRRIAAELAAGLLLMNESANVEDALYTRGLELRKGALAMLTSIQNKELNLFDGDGDELTEATTETIDYSPSDTTDEDEGFRFTTNETDQPR